MHVRRQLCPTFVSCVSRMLGQWLSCKSYASYYHGTSGVKQLHCVVANLSFYVQLFCSNGKIRRCFVTSYLQGWSHTATGHILPLFSTRKPIPTKLFCSIFRKALLSHRLYIYIYICVFQSDAFHENTCNFNSLHKL